jgi:Na+/H+-dicarboxylate symporter
VPEDVIQRGSGEKLLLEGSLITSFQVNIADAIVRGDVLQIVMFSTLFAVAVTRSGREG